MGSAFTEAVIVKLPAVLDQGVDWTLLHLAGLFFGTGLLFLATNAACEANLPWAAAMIASIVCSVVGATRAWMDLRLARR